MELSAYFFLQKWGRNRNPVVHFKNLIRIKFWRYLFGARMTSLKLSISNIHNTWVEFPYIFSQISSVFFKSICHQIDFHYKFKLKHFDYYFLYYLIQMKNGNGIDKITFFQVLFETSLVSLFSQKRQYFSACFQHIYSTKSF